jgi:hypothetical protein
MAIIIALTLFLAAVIGFSLVMKRFNATGVTISKLPVTPPPPSKKPKEELKEILDGLLKLNLMIRKDMDFPEEMVLKIEVIIDDLKTIIPAMMERHPKEALTHEIKRIGLSHLYKTVKKFLDLPCDNRQNKLGNFKKTVKRLNEVTHKSRDLIENNKTAEFNPMAHTLANKFS